MNNLDKLIGEVLWFDPKRGYGFIAHAPDGVKGADLFVHFSDVASEGFKTLYKGQKVSYSMGVNKHGSPKAIDVVVLKQ